MKALENARLKHELASRLEKQAYLELKDAEWIDLDWQTNLYRRGVDCNWKLLREKGIAPPAVEELSVPSEHVR